MKNTKLFRKLYIYFKKGKNEIFFIISIYNTYLISKLTNDQDIYLIAFLFFSLVIGSFIVGYVSTKFVTPTNQIVSPFSQDSLKSGILFKEALYCMISGRADLALEHLRESIRLNNKWIDK